MLQRFGDELFKTDEVNPRGSGKMWMKLLDYMEYMRLNHDEDPIYMFDDKFGEHETKNVLLQEFEVPIYFQDDYFDALEEERPPYRWICWGPERSNSPFHLDPYQSSAWNALIYGRKRWALYPHDLYPPGIEIEFDDDGNFDHDSPEALKWYLEEYPHVESDKKPLECILEAGELIFVPSGWWHMVLNLQESLAVTQNYCNDHNFQIVCSEISYDDDDFYEDFQTRLTSKRKDIQFPTTLQKSGFRKG